MRTVVARQLDLLTALASGRPAGHAPEAAGAELVEFALAFGLSPLEVDALCLILGAEVVPALQASVGTRLTVSQVLDVLVPDLMSRLELLGEGFPRRLVAAGLIRPLRAGLPCDELILTRRARAVLVGAHPLSSLGAVGRVQDLLSVSGPRLPSDLTRQEEAAFHKTTDDTKNAAKKSAYADWRDKSKATKGSLAVRRTESRSKATRVVITIALLLGGAFQIARGLGVFHHTQ